MDTPTRLEKFKAFFRILFCRHKVAKPFVVQGGNEGEDLKVLFSGEQCVRCKGKRYSNAK